MEVSLYRELTPHGRKISKDAVVSQSVAQTAQNTGWKPMLHCAVASSTLTDEFQDLKSTVLSLAACLRNPEDLRFSLKCHPDASGDGVTQIVRTRKFPVVVDIGADPVVQ